MRHPPEWRSTTEAGRCVQFQAGRREEPHGVPEVDVFLQVEPLAGAFPGDYLATGPPDARGVTYAGREELALGGRVVVRARFSSGGGPVPNWGVEYAVRKGGDVLRVYASKPGPDVEEQLATMIESLRW